MSPLTPHHPGTSSVRHFDSGGRSIRVERFEPSQVGEPAAVLLLHGADGLTYRGPSYREMARELAEAGYLGLLLYYYDSTDSDGLGSLFSQPLNFVTWMEVVGDAVGYAREQFPGAEPRVGLVGFSLGAYLALSAATQDPRVAAVVDCFGGLPDLFAHTFTQMPPVLILHGEADPVVPVSEARKLERLLKAHGREYEMHLYPGAGHTFHGATAHDAFRRIRAFLDRHLKGVEAAGLQRRAR